MKNNFFNFNKIGIIGLGYVGLPLAIEFGKKFDVIGFDTNLNRVDQLKKKIDNNNEISKKKFIESNKLTFSSSIGMLSQCNIFIISVPTPILKNKNPDLRILKSACNKVAKLLKKEDIIIFESTVYPGLTEEVCVPLIENISLLKYNIDFFCGYSPERINPGDKKHSLNQIIKITSGSNRKTLNIVDKLYRSIIKAGTFRASSIKVAEAAKIIENTQRDLNIAFVNELAIIFNKMNIDTADVLKAASTKRNFLNFSPGLVGGHCIGVDPYYLTFKAKSKNYQPKLILAGRNLNENFDKFLLKKLFYQMTLKSFNLSSSKFLIMGLTFKENCNDIRNSKVFKILDKFKSKRINFEVYDPYVDKVLIKKDIANKIIEYPKSNYYDVIIITVAHSHFKNLGFHKIRNFANKKNIIFDVKNIFPNKAILRI